ncbi:acyltransferase family protein [Janibacter sp. GXQ6167]|uniref:acyltransferase family protein n=1 Tax=Janibacter sp. GXQ6167 TaxID=3240791 RepID=UPI0035241715
MPRPQKSHGQYYPGLDGVRALAVIAVVAYHLGVPGVGGGLLGVGVFFTLSGYLITSLLIAEHSRHGRIRLGQFWIRRARRLLPAVIVVLGVVLVATALVNRDDLGRMLGSAGAALFYVANWHTIAAGDSYFARFQAPDPLGHLWSLSIEEQFYLVWPLLLLLLPVLARGRKVWVVRITVFLALASFVLLAVLAQPGMDNTRAYEGTDTRAGGLLLGAAAAMVWPLGSRPNAGARLSARGWDVAGVLGLGAIAALVATTDQYSMSLYRGGLLALTVATIAVVVAVGQPGSLLGRVLGVAPLRWIGERSYGIYLWHLPVLIFVGPRLGSLAPVWRGVVLVAMILTISALSWVLVEDPIRKHGLRAAWRGRVTKPARAGLVARAGALTTTAVAGLTVPALAFAASPTVDAASPLSDANPAPPPRAVATAPKTPAPSVRPMTRCERVIHVGDSTSEGLISPDYLPKPEQRIDAQYRDFGAKEVTTDISGARSIVETWKDQPNAEQAVQSHAAEAGPGTCWVFAMGTNDTANQFVGGVVPYGERIERLMKHVGDAPVMWVNVKSLLSSGPYSDANMQAWDDALVTAAAKYPNMRVYDWRSEVKRSWYQADGIHFTSAGYAQRAKRIARALGRAFPAQGESPTQVLVSSR